MIKKKKKEKDTKRASMELEKAEKSGDCDYHDVIKRVGL